MQLLVRRWDDHWELQGTPDAKKYLVEIPLYTFQMHRADTFQML